MDSPEERRDVAVAAVIAAGGTVNGAEPLAHPDNPQVVAAYRLRVGIPHPDVEGAVAGVRGETEAGLSGLVPWQPEPVEDDEEVDDA